MGKATKWSPYIVAAAPAGAHESNRMFAKQPAKIITDRRDSAVALQ